MYKYSSLYIIQVSASGCRDWILFFRPEGALARTWTEVTKVYAYYLFQLSPPFVLLFEAEHLNFTCNHYEVQ